MTHWREDQWSSPGPMPAGSSLDPRGLRRIAAEDAEDHELWRQWRAECDEQDRDTHEPEEGDWYVERWNTWQWTW